MSVIDGHTNSLKFRRLFSNRSTSHNRVVYNPDGTISMPGFGQELSIADTGKLSGATGRYIRIFCEQVYPTAHFKTVFVKDSTTVLECIQGLVAQVSGKEDKNADKYTLYEVVGRFILKKNQVSSNDNISEGFSEIRAHELQENEKLMDILGLMAPAKGLSRRIELRLKTTPTLSTTIQNSFIETPTTQFDATTTGPNTRLFQGNVFAPLHPYFLLIKGSSPKTDLLIHNLNPLFSGSKDFITIGTSESDDIQLHPAQNDKSHQDFALGDSPIKLYVKQDKDSSVKILWIEITSNFNAIDPNDPLKVVINWDSVSGSTSNPMKRCLNPGDIIQVEATKITYMFLFKDSVAVPEHQLTLGFLSLPQFPSVKSVSSSVSRSASRTARISAAKEPLKPPNGFVVRKPSTSREALISKELSLPTVMDIASVVELLFLNPKEPIPVDVSISAGCFAHLVRSITARGLSTRGTAYAAKASEDALLQAANAALSAELEALMPSSPRHLTLAIWKVAFCFYLTQYLSPGWLCNPPPTKPRIFASDRRLQRTPSSPDSEVFHRNVNVIRSHSRTSSFADEFERLPVLSAIREKTSAEADYVMDIAIDFALETTSKYAVKLCHLFARSSQSIRVKNKQTALFIELDKLQVCLTQVFKTQLTRPPSRLRNDSGTVKLVQAEEYHQEGDRESGNGSLDKRLISDADDFSSEESFRRNSLSSAASSVVETKEGDVVGNLQSQFRIEEVFFRRLLAGLTRKMIEEFLNSPTLIINWETGVQLLNMVKALDNWMRCTGIINYKPTLNLIYDFAGLMATPRKELLAMNWSQIHQRFLNLPSSILSFLLESYENGHGMQRNGSNWLSNEAEADESAHDYLQDFSSHWETRERLHVTNASSVIINRPGATYRPLDLASIFQSAKAKESIRRFDQVLVKQKLNFQWTNLLKCFPPPGLMPHQQDSEGITLRKKSVELDEEAAFGLPYEFMSGSQDIRDFADLHREVRQGNLGSPYDDLSVSKRQTQTQNLQPIHSYNGPSRSVVNANNYGQNQNNTKSELGLGSHQYNTINKLAPVAGGGFRSRPGIFEIGRSNYPSNDRNRFPRSACARNINGRYFSSTVNVARSAEFADARSTLEDWNSFKREASRPNSPSHNSTLDANSRYLGGGSSVTLNHAQLMTQSDYPDQFESQSLTGIQSNRGINSRRQPSSTSDWMSSARFGSSGSLLGVDVNRSQSNVENTIINVVLEKVATESYGIVLVDGYTTRLEQLGIYIKSLTPDSLAALSGKLAVGDRILAINGTELTTMIFKDVCRTLRASELSVTLTIQRGCVDNPSDLRTLLET